MDKFSSKSFEKAQEKPATPEEYRIVLDGAVANGLIPQDYADTIRNRYPAWGIKHLEQIRDRERLLADMVSNEVYGLTEDRLFELRQRDPDYAVRHLEQIRDRERLLADMVSNEVYGLTEDRLFELRQRNPDYAVRHLEYLKQREVLIDNLQKRNLLDANIISSVRNLEDPWYACKQLTELGNREVVDKILPLLRGEKPVARFDLPAVGDSIKTHIVESLKSAGIYRPGLKVRFISRERLQKALSTGTDRDHSSLVTIHHGGDDGEELAMKENGLDAKMDLGQVTYVSELDTTWSADAKRHGDLVVLVYAPEALKAIQPSQNKTNSFANGFHMFVDKRLIQPSLLAVFHREQSPSFYNFS
jgi:hypothetical protein